jgi:hypothetical protein
MQAKEPGGGVSSLPATQGNILNKLKLKPPESIQKIELIP